MHKPPKHQPSVSAEKYQRPLLFLDFDDVICLNAPYGGYSAKAAIDEGVFHRTQDVHEKLFDSEAKKFLAAIDEEFKPVYVLSTSWRLMFQLHQLVEILNYCGLQFVTAGLHQEWATPAQPKQGLRAAEIKSWLRHYPEFSNSWAVLDDKLSGNGFKVWNAEDRSYVVLCQEHVGLREAEYAQLRTALQRRLTES